MPIFKGILARPVKVSRPVFRYEDDALYAFDGGSAYKVDPKGKTFLVTREEKEIPIGGTRYPEQLAKWYGLRFIKSRWGGAYILSLIAIVVGCICAAYLPQNQNPFAEYTLYAFPTFSKWAVLVINYAAVGSFALLVLALIGRRASEEIYLGVQAAMKPKAEETQLLEAGNPLAPDYLIESLSPAETADSFLSRFQEARQTYGTDCFVIAAPFRSDKLVICHPAPADSEQAEEVPGVRAAYVSSAIGADVETWEEYEYFLGRVRQPLKDYCFGQRSKMRGAAAALAATMRATITALLILCFVVPGMAQPKTQRLYNYLGTRAETIIPHDDTQVEFHFEGATLTRTGDGRSNLVNLMQKPRVFTDDDNAGSLREVKINGEVLPPIKGSEKAQTMKTNYSVGEGSAVEMPDGSGPPSKGGGFWASIPDSAQLVEVERSGDAFIRQSGKEVKSRWVVGMRMFWKWGLPFISLIAFCCYFVAKTAFNEMKHSSARAYAFFKPLAFWGYGARYGVFACVGIVALATLIDGLIIDMIESDSLWEWFFVSAIKLTAIYFLTTWIVPNPPKSHKEEENPFAAPLTLGTGR